MPIEHRVDHEQRLVVARVVGTLTDPEIFGYQLKVWSQPEVAGYSELVDMREAGPIEIPSPDRVPLLARVSAEMDSPSDRSRMAIVAPGEFEAALGKLYASHRGLSPHSTKEVRVFGSMEEAVAWLGVRI